MKIPIHALALLVLLDSTVSLAAAKKHRHHKSAVAQRALQDEDATPEIAILDFGGTKVALDCIQCSNIPTEHMLLISTTCATYSYAWERRCGTEFGWWGRDGNPEHCQYSCWKNGAPYATQGGVPCCERDDGDDDVGGDGITAAPTSTPEEPTDFPTGIPETDEPTPSPTSPVYTDAPTPVPTDDPVPAEPTASATFPTVAITPEPSDPIPVSEPTAMRVSDEATTNSTTDAADDIEESDDEMAAILSEIQTRPAAEDDEEEELDLLGGAIDLGVPVTVESQNATGVDIGGDVPDDVSDEYLKVMAVEELAIVEEVVDELEAEASETSMAPTTAHPTLISMTTFDVVDGKVVIPTPPPVDASVAAPAAAPDAALVAETTEPDSTEGEPFPYVWLAPTNEPTTFSPTPNHVWLSPTPFPTAEPSATPSTTPTVTLSAEPSEVHSSAPTMMHSRSPSAPPTPAPTGMPSSKPSPSPTGSPSAEPTADPTSSPSAAPTVTASASPSEVPSLPPTHSPSEVPSASPTGAPSAVPTLSPSDAPSAQPTARPSNMPSTSPSASPTSSPSSSPSSAPTPYATTMETGVYLRLVGISETMDGIREAIFEETAKEFIASSMASTAEDGVEVSVVEAKVLTQSVTNVSPSGDSADLLIELNIVGLVHPHKPPLGFSFPSTVLNGFVRDFIGFTDALYESSDFFHPLGHSDNPEPSEIAKRVKEWEEDNNNVGIAIGSTIAALAIGLSVGVLAKRNRDAKNALEDASLGSMSKDFQRPYGAEALRSPNNSLPSIPLSPSSPNTVESGRGRNWNFRPDMSPDVHTRASGVPHSRSDASYLTWKTKESVTSKGEIGRQIGLSMSMEEKLQNARLSQGLVSPSGTEENLSVPKVDSYSQSDGSSNNRYAYAQQYLGGDQEGRDDVEGTAMPPRQPSPTADAHAMQMSQFGMQPYQIRRELYDCYAPPGPLGIVIDTTAEGPMVHSLKPTSRLAGLLQPGDLVVGLDDIDTRGMTAATLTRLMAKRSQQAQRKITLLSARAPSEVSDCE